MSIIDFFNLHSPPFALSLRVLSWCVFGLLTPVTVTYQVIIIN
jgi:hypothetical protein